MLGSLRFGLAVAVGWILLASSVALAADSERGKGIYTTHCATCHGEKGDGLGPEGQFLDPAPRDFRRGGFRFDTNGDGVSGGDEDLRDFILYGSAAFGGSPVMAGFDMLTAEELADLIAYLRSFRP